MVKIHVGVGQKPNIDAYHPDAKTFIIMNTRHVTQWETFETLMAADKPVLLASSEHARVVVSMRA